ncbi:hypothetical protein ACYJW8_15625 [Frateuria aurantia]
MAWREKTAWLTLVLMLLTYSLYFSLVLTSSRTPLEQLWLFGEVSLSQAIIMAVASAALALTTGRESRGLPDERDLAISRRATRVAYFVLMAGLIVVGVVMPLIDQGWHIVNAALLALVLAEVLRHAIVVIGYRRGWHG